MKIKSKKLEKLKSDTDKMEELFYEIYKNKFFEDEWDMISSRETFKKGFLSAIDLIGKRNEK